MYDFFIFHFVIDIFALKDALKTPPFFKVSLAKNHSRTARQCLTKVRGTLAQINVFEDFQKFRGTFEGLNRIQNLTLMKNIIIC